MRRARLTIILLGLAFACCDATAGRSEPLRIALIVANGQYANFPATARCAPSAAAARYGLRAKGFEIIERSNLGRGEFDTAIGILARRIAASPPAIAASACLMKVRMRLTRAPLMSARRALRRMRFFACGVFAILLPRNDK